MPTFTWFHVDLIIRTVRGEAPLQAASQKIRRRARNTLQAPPSGQTGSCNPSRCKICNGHATSPPVHARRVFLVGLVSARLRNHLNCGTVGTLMRGGDIGATPTFPVELGIDNCSSAPILAAAFGRTPPETPIVECPIAAPPPWPPPPRANEAAGAAKTMTNAIATFTRVFDMGKLHYLTY